GEQSEPSATRPSATRPSAGGAALIKRFLRAFLWGAVLATWFRLRLLAARQLGSHGNQATATPVPTAGHDAPAAAGNPPVAAFAPRAHRGSGAGAGQQPRPFR